MLNHTLFNQALMRDLVAHGALQPDVIVGLVRWFAPEHKDYVSRVTEWQKFLVAGAATDLCVGPLLVRAGVATVITSNTSSRQVYSLRQWGRPDAEFSQKIKDVHQIAMFWWKEEISVDPVWDDYIARITTSGTPCLSDPVIGRLAQFCKRLLGKAPSWADMVGRAGNGTTADRRNLRDRWLFDSIPLGIPTDFYRYNPHDRTPSREDVILTARASAVPKNRKSARLVASEPAAAMFAQLAIMDALDKRLIKYRNRLPIRDADQHRAFLVAHSTECVTIDLSDASDYISLELVHAILPADWFALLSACRSQAVRIPDGRTVRLNTFAPMGNGFCFRLLSLVCLGILAISCTRLYSDFGDDMICLRQDANRVLYGLKVCGLVVSNDKTCFDTYKESCGLELFGEYNISPFKPKRLLTYKDSLVDISAAARAALRDLPEVATACVAGIKKVPVRFNRDLQRLEWRLPVWTTRKLQVACDDWPGMLRWYVQRGTSYSNAVPEHTRTVPGYRWCSGLTEALVEEGLSSSELVSLLLSLQTVDKICRHPIAD